MKEPNVILPDISKKDNRYRFLSSAAEARRLLVHTKNREDIFEIASWIDCEKEALAGNAPDFCQLIKALRERGENAMAKSVCKHILSKYVNCELLAEALLLCDGDFEEGKQYMKLAERISLWDDSLFRAAIAWHILCVKNEPETEPAFAEKARRLCDSYRTQYPEDEQGYYLRAKLDEALRVPKRKIINWLMREALTLSIDPMDNQRHLVCPRCCELLLRLMERDDDYEQILYVAGLAIQYGDSCGDDALVQYATRRAQAALRAMNVRDRLAQQGERAFFESMNVNNLMPGRETPGDALLFEAVNCSNLITGTNPYELDEKTGGGNENE